MKKKKVNVKKILKEARRKREERLEAEAIERKKLPRHFIRRFTYKESYDILRNLIERKRATKDTYALILLWLTGLLYKQQYAHLKNLANGSIYVTDFTANSEGIQELVHDIIIELMDESETLAGKKRGLKHKVGWKEFPLKDEEGNITGYRQVEGNEGQVVAYLNRAFKVVLNKCLGKDYRGSMNYSTVYTLRKNPKIVALKARMENETDMAITTPELISELIDEGYDDVDLFLYRYAYSLGSYKTFTPITDEIISKGSLNKCVNDLTSPELLKKLLYEEVFNILNSNLMPKINREFLKCWYEIPTVVVDEGVRKIFSPDMVIFFYSFPDYKQILRAKRIAYWGKKRTVQWINKNELPVNSALFKESHEMLKNLIIPKIKQLHARYIDNLDQAKELVLGDPSVGNLGSDSIFDNLISSIYEE